MAAPTREHALRLLATLRDADGHVPPDLAREIDTALAAHYRAEAMRMRRLARDYDRGARETCDGALSAQASTCDRIADDFQAMAEQAQRRLDRLTTAAVSA